MGPRVLDGDEERPDSTAPDQHARRHCTGGFPMKRIVDHVIPPKLGFGLVVKKGQTLRITDLEGKQVVDMAVFNLDNPRGVHDTHNRMCNRFLYESYGVGP